MAMGDYPWMLHGAANHPTTGLNYFTTNGTTILPYVPSYTTGDFPMIPSNPPSINLPYFPTLEKEKKSVRGLYEVFIVDPETADFSQWTTIANSEENARLNAVLDAQKHEKYGAMIGRNSIDDLDIIVRFIGAVREKKDKAK